MKKILAFACAAALSTCAMAQYEGTSVDERIEKTAGADSVKIGRGHVSTFQMSCGSQDWPEAYISWKWLMQYAPYAISGLYKGNAPLMLYTLAKTSTVDADKLKYFNDLMNLFDERANRLEALNSFEKSDRTKSTLGDVLSVKAEYYNWTAPIVPGSGYTLNKSYDNFAKAIKEINENGGREVTGGFLQTFFQVSDAIYKYYDDQIKAGKAQSNVWREQYLQDYLDSKDACEKMLSLAKEAEADGDTARAQKLVTTYDGPLAYIEQAFAASGAADRDQIIAIYTKKLDTYKTDINKLNSAINLMAANDCDDSDIYYQYAEAAYTIQPTYTSAIGLAQKAQKEGKNADAVKYYDKALELASSDAIRGMICLRISKALASTNLAKSNEYVEKAVNYNHDLAGKAYLQQAINMVHANNNSQALAFCEKAAAADITVAPSANRLKEQIQKVNAANAQIAKQKAEYEAAKKRQAEEDAFWKGGGKK